MLVTAVLLCMTGSMVSGIVLSYHVFGFLPFHGELSWARTLHLLCSYWGLIMMSLHIGFHVSVIIGMVRTHIGLSSRRTWLLRIVGAAIAVYGAVAFVRREIRSYLFLKNMFVFLDFTEPLVGFFLDYAAIMGLFVFMGHYFTGFLKWFHRKQKRVVQSGENECA